MLFRSTDFVANGGVITVSSSSASFVVAPAADNVTEGAQSFSISVRSQSNVGPVKATSINTIIGDTSKTPPTFAFTVIPNSIIEGNADRFNVRTTDIANDSIMYWTIEHGTTSVLDFVSTSGSFRIQDNIGSFVVFTLTRSGVSSNKTFSVKLRTLSITGSVVATSDNVIIADSSTSLSTSYITNSVTVTGVGLWNSVSQQVVFLQGSPSYQIGRAHV
mgnify:FL=1